MNFVGVTHVWCWDEWMELKVLLTVVIHIDYWCCMRFCLQNCMSLKIYSVNVITLKCSVLLLFVEV